jgi:hypothetical protein
MKKITAVLIGLLCLPAYAEIVPADYWDQQEAAESQVADDVMAQTGEETQAQPTNQTTSAPTVASPRATIARSGTRAVSSAKGTTSTRTSAAPSRAVASRNSSISIRSMMTPNSGTVSSRQSSNFNVNSARVGITQTNTVSAPLYNSARVAVRPSAIGSVASARVASVSTGTTTSSSTSTGTDMEEIAQLTDFCKAQYFSCMDNFCNILDDNQGRCSCSSNIKNYQKVEDALKSATEELQSVALQIQYLGLSKEEVVSLFTQTEAEEAMSGTQDTTDLKNDLDKIQKLIIDIKPSSSSGTDNAFDIDFSNFDFTLDSGLDLSSLFGSSNSISNQRGAELYKTAVARCKTAVIDTCKKQGVDTAIVSNGYDLEIDKQCIVYERALDDSNTQMKRTVLNAKSVLQKARLAVAKNRNSYDMRGCISALDTCMQSDYVCGSDYDKCLDPTGKYIVDGEIVSNVTSGDILAGLDEAWGSGTGNAWTGDGLTTFITTNLGNFDSSNMLGFLETKIGNINTQGAETGMCINVLKKCQNYAFIGTNKTYEPTNDVVREFMSQALTKIKNRQDNLVEDYVSNCKADVQSCLVSNGAIVGDTGLNVGYVSNAIYNACKTIASTCAGASSSTGTAAELVHEVACYTANDGTPGVSNAWSIGSPASVCKCPVGTTWSGATKTCNCPSDATWSYDLGACVCTDPTKEIQVSGSTYICVVAP